MDTFDSVRFIDWDQRVYSNPVQRIVKARSARGKIFCPDPVTDFIVFDFVVYTLALGLLW